MVAGEQLFPSTLLISCTRGGILMARLHVSPQNPVVQSPLLQPQVALRRMVLQYSSRQQESKSRSCELLHQPSRFCEGLICTCLRWSAGWWSWPEHLIVVFSTYRQWSCSGISAPSIPAVTEPVSFIGMQVLG